MISFPHLPALLELLDTMLRPIAFLFERSERQNPWLKKSVNYTFVCPTLFIYSVSKFVFVISRSILSQSHTYNDHFKVSVKLYCDHRYTWPCMINRTWGLKHR